MRPAALILPGQRVSPWPSPAASPTARVTVHNRAVARQTTQEMAARLDQEVIALKPLLVIWETGTTDAVRGTELDEFRQTIQDGIDRLRQSGLRRSWTCSSRAIPMP